MSQADVSIREIDGATYGVYMLPPKVARKMLVRILQVFGPSIGEALGRIDDDLSSAIGPAISTLADRLSDEDLDWMMKALAEVSTAESVPGAAPYLKDCFDLHFRGRVGAMFKWFAFCLEVQFADFWSGSEGGFQGLLDRVKAVVSPSPITSTGTSGDPLSQKDAA